MQRARGEVVLALRRRGARTVLADLRQEGCLKLRFPRGCGHQSVLLNSSGGVAGGDRLRVSVTLQAGASATLATQAAERFYRARDDDRMASVHAEVTLAAGAALHWLPQEAILFDGCAIDRRLLVTMDADATFLGVEALVFGRQAMGEDVRQARIADTIRVLRDGRLVLHDAIRLSGEVASRLARPAIAGGARAMATILHVAPDAGERIDALRDALAAASARDGVPPGAIEAGVSAWDGMLVARLLARDGACLRAAIVAGLASLRGSLDLPRVWLC